jgi:pyruvate formate lyase activating enzyme
MENENIKHDELKCAACDKCLEACPYFSSPRYKMMSAGEIFEQIKKSAPFVKGLTVSGGECLLYKELLEELFELSHTIPLTNFIDTNATFPLVKYEKLLAHTDGVMVDLKAWDDDVYKKVAGGSPADNNNVKENIKFLLDAKKLYEVRLVCFDEMRPYETLSSLKDFLGKAAQDVRIKLIAFRNIGVRGRMALCENTTLETLRSYAEAFKHCFNSIATI